MISSGFSHEMDLSLVISFIAQNPLWNFWNPPLHVSRGRGHRSRCLQALSSLAFSPKKHRSVTCFPTWTPMERVTDQPRCAISFRIWSPQKGFLH